MVQYFRRNLILQYGDAGVFHETCSVFSSERRGIYGYKAPKIICLRGTLQTPVAFCLACVQIPPPYTGYFLFHNKEQRKRTSICLLWRVNNKSERNGLCNNCAHGKDVNYIAGYLKFLSFKFVKTFFANLRFREFQNITKIAKVIKFINNKASFVDII